jgi:hypothetical protein
LTRRQEAEANIGEADGPEGGRGQDARNQTAVVVREAQLANKYNGEMAEWFKAAVLKTAVGVSLPWVRIPLSPPPIKKRPAGRFFMGGGESGWTNPLGSTNLSGTNLDSRRLALERYARKGSAHGRAEQSHTSPNDDQEKRAALTLRIDLCPEE